MTGYVYAIEGESGRIKIGWSTDPVRRLVKLKTDSASDARLLGFVEATRSQEAELHKLLARWRLHGEWFKPEGAVLAFLEMLPKPAPKPVPPPYIPQPARSGISLKEWLEIPNPDGSRKRRYAFAAAIGVTPGMITEYVNKGKWPSRETMRAIVRETAGAVTANNFLRPPEAAQ